MENNINIDLQNVYEALYFFETLSPCYSCYHRADGCTELAIENPDGVCHMKQQALKIMWDAIKEIPIKKYSLPK